MIQRRLIDALCDRGEPTISRPSQCCVGGHPCWERIVEPEGELPMIPSSPLALSEAFDFLDAVWRLAFGKHKSLMRLKNATDIAKLAQPCATRADFESGVSALADVLKLMTIPDDLLAEESRRIAQEQTLKRLEACLQAHLNADDYPSCERAIGVLRTVNSVRAAFQHSGGMPQAPQA